MPFARTAWTLLALAGLAALVYGLLYRGAGLWALAAVPLLAAAWRLRAHRPRIRPADMALAAGSTVFALAAAFTVVELCVRLLVHPAAWQGDSLVSHHPTRIWTPAPGASGTGYVPSGPQSFAGFDFTIADYGLRGPEPVAKAPGEFRVLLLGDSFTFGRGVNDEETIAVQLEGLLRDRIPGRTVTVVNGGCGGYAPWQAESLFAELGLPLDPDAVVLQLLMDNDIADTLARDGRLPEAYEPGNAYFKTVYARLDTDLRARLEDAVYRASRAYKFLVQRTLGVWRITRLLDGLRGFDGPLVPDFPPSAPRPAHLEAARINWDAAFDDGWRAMQADILAIRDACAAHGLPFLVYAVPTAAYVDDTAWPFAADPAYDRDKPARLVREFAAAAAIEYHDAFGHFRGLPEPGNLYYPVDGHFTAAGARAAAEFLAGPVAALIPPEPSSRPNLEPAAYRHVHLGSARSGPLPFRRPNPAPPNEAGSGFRPPLRIPPLQEVPCASS